MAKSTSVNPSLPTAPVDLDSDLPPELPVEPKPGEPVPGHAAGIEDPRYLMPGPDSPTERWGEEEGLREELEELDDRDP